MLGALERQRGPLEAAWISGGGTVLMLALILGARALRGDGPELPAPLDRPWPFALVAAPLAHVGDRIRARRPAVPAAERGCSAACSSPGRRSWRRASAWRWLFSAVTAGTLSGGLVLDHIGAFGAGVERATVMRLLGVLVVFAGVVIVRSR